MSYSPDDFQADLNQDQAKDTLEMLIRERSDDSEQIERLAEIVPGGWEMLANAGYSPSKLPVWIEEIL